VTIADLPSSSFIFVSILSSNQRRERASIGRPFMKPDCYRSRY